jgi:23S rRNA (pseudouridine1915-N3)-methyltransferase
MITVISIGRKHDTWLENAIQRYQKRLRAPFTIKWELIAPSPQKESVAQNDESTRILRTIKKEDIVILLDEQGINYDSFALSRELETHLDQSKKVVVIIGGAYGVNNELKARANTIWSLSRLVFPHQIIRLLVIEQIYRSYTIARSLPYHNG